MPFIPKIEIRREIRQIEREEAKKTQRKIMTYVSFFSALLRSTLLVPSNYERNRETYS